MPLTAFQKEVLRLLASQRKPESHVGGGAAINRNTESPRFSADLDLFHDVAEAVVVSAEKDAAVLTGHGFTMEWLLRQPSLQRARVSRGADVLRLDWCVDSAFRFFPVQADADFGYCLHPADLATNKCLALAGGAEIRDFLYILYLHNTYLSLGAVCWAACGKDQGFTPWSLLDFAKRNMKFRTEDLASENLVKPVTLPDLKQAWLQTVAEAETWFPRLPQTDIGCLYLDAAQVPITPNPADPGFAEIHRHFGSLGGAWPTTA